MMQWAEELEFVAMNRPIDQAPRHLGMHRVKVEDWTT